MIEVSITPREIEPFAEIIGAERAERFAATLAAARERLGGARVWHVNSTATGGGVAEILQSVLSYPLAAGIDVGWLAIESSEDFFALTKRIHHLLHGSQGDGGPLAEDERALYEECLAGEAEALSSRVQPGDMVILHDPQVLGLAPGLRRAGIPVIWSCHIGADRANAQTRRAWEFLSRYVAATTAQSFTRRQYRWENLPEANVAVIPPCIDALATKNRELDEQAVQGLLDASGVVASRDGSASTAWFARPYGGKGEVRHRARMVQDQPLDPGAPIVCQISRWDPLKDHLGLMRAFVAHVGQDAQLVLAGPAASSVDDDPESGQTVAELERGWEQLGALERRRVHICSLPMEDVEENAAVVNALQRRADVVVQKSLAEGFGLTVAEAMWKGRPTVGSRVGGIQDQIEPGRSGLLVDPGDPADLGSAVSSLLEDPAMAAELGRAGRRRVIDNYLAPSYLARQFELVAEVLGERRRTM